MKINLNGKIFDSDSPTLMDLVLKQGFDTKSLIVEYNFDIVSQESWKEILIKEGDTIELLSFVGGG